MTREVPLGTPTRTRSYVFPERDRRVLLLGVGAGAALIMLFVGLYFGGEPGWLNPAPVASAHAAFEQECVQCHVVGGAVSDVRCERCHDSASSQRLSIAAHVLLGSHDPRKARDSVEVACMSCHTEHRGRGFDLAAIDDRRCGSCHEFSSLARHPEFAAAKAEIQTGVGLLFNHEAHFTKGGLRGCEPCHRATPDLRGFEPLSFDRGCTAPCHFHVDTDGNLQRQPDPVLSETVLIPPPSQLMQPAAASRVQIVDDRGETLITGVSHRDPWLMLAARTLGRRIDPEQEDLYEAGLNRQILWLQQQLASQPLSDVQVDALIAWRPEVAAEVEALTRLLAASGSADDDTALQEIRQRLAELTAQLPELGGELATQRDAILSAAGSPAIAADAADDPAAVATRTQRRVEELSALVDAVRARAEAGEDLALVGEAELLRTAIAGLTTEASAEPTDTSVLERRLDDLDGLLVMIAEVENPAAREQLRQIRLMRDLARQRLRQGLTASGLENRRSELLDLLAWIQTEGPPELQLEAFHAAPARPFATAWRRRFGQPTADPEPHQPVARAGRPGDRTAAGWSSRPSSGARLAARPRHGATPDRGAAGTARHADRRHRGLRSVAGLRSRWTAGRVHRVDDAVHAMPHAGGGTAGPDASLRTGVRARHLRPRPTRDHRRVRRLPRRPGRPRARSWGVFVHQRP